MKVLLALAAVVVGVVGLRWSRGAQHDPWHEATAPSAAPHPGT